MDETEQSANITQQNDPNSVSQVYVSDNNGKSDNLLTKLRPGRLTAILSVLLIVIAVPIALHVLSQPTDIPIKASTGTTLSITGNQNFAIGQKVSLNVLLDPGGKAISSAKIVINYNGSKLQRDINGLIPNPKAFPSIIQGPIYDQCSNNNCTMSVTLSIGADPTKVITQATKIATINFTAIQITSSTGTLVSFNDTQSQVFSISSDSSANKSVLATTVPINIIISKTLPSGSPVPSTTISPSQTPTPSTTGTPSPTISTTQTPSPTPPIGAQNTFLNLALKLEVPHDATTGAAIQPQQPTRQATVYLYKQNENPQDPSVQPQYTAVDTISYEPSTQNFVNHKFLLGKIPTGNYQILAKVNQYLRKLIVQGITLQTGGTTNVGITKLTAGDIMPQGLNGNFGDNILDLDDYNLLAACFGANANTSACANKSAADLDNNGSVDGIDYNIMIRNIVTIQGYNGNNWQTSTISPNIKDTKLAVTVFLDGIGKAGDNTQRGYTGNTQPSHPTRQITVSISSTLGTFIEATIGTVTYDSSQGAFLGTIDAGNLPTGDYSIGVITPQFLGGLIPGTQSVKAGQTNTIRRVYLTAGDVNGDNSIDLKDYQILANCFNNSQSLCTALQKNAADLNDDGVVDLSDYNLFIRELSVHSGD